MAAICTAEGHARRTRTTRGRETTYCVTCQNAKAKRARAVAGPPSIMKLFRRLAGFRGVTRESVRRKAGDLTFETFARIRGDLCHYCGDHLPVNGLGLDRIDTRRGYDEGNVLPCCTLCNRARGAGLSVEEFQLVIDQRMIAGRCPWTAEQRETGRL